MSLRFRNFDLFSDTHTSPLLFIVAYQNNARIARTFAIYCADTRIDYITDVIDGLFAEFTYLSMSNHPILE